MHAGQRALAFLRVTMKDEDWVDQPHHCEHPDPAGRRDNPGNEDEEAYEEGPRVSHASGAHGRIVTSVFVAVLLIVADGERPDAECLPDPVVVHARSGPFQSIARGLCSVKVR
jgi:hypothetical protein